MAGRNQLLLLVDRGSLSSSFERLWAYLAKADYPKAAVSYFVETFADKDTFEKALTEVEINYSAEIERQGKLGSWVRLPYAAATISLRHYKLDGLWLSLEIQMSSYEAYLSFPNLYDAFTLLTINVRGAGTLHGEEEPNDQKLAWEILEIVNCFRPFYGFQERDNTVYSRAEGLHERNERQRQAYRKKFRAQPWAIFNMTMIYGEVLTEKISRARLLASPATSKLGLSNITALWGPRGLLDEGDVTPAYLAHDYDAECQFIIDYERALADHLGVEIES